MFWIKVLSLGISCLLLLVNGLPTSVLLDSKTAALKSGDGGGGEATDSLGGHDGALLSTTMSSSSAAPSASDNVKRTPKKRGAILPQSTTGRSESFLPYLLSEPAEHMVQDENRRAGAGGGGYWSDLEDGYFEGPGGRAQSGLDNNYYGYAPFRDADQEQADEDEEIAELINSREGFSEPVALPVLFSPSSVGRDAGFYGLGRNLGMGGAARGAYRKKRSNKRNEKSFRLKRDSNRIDAAEALALLELIEAQEEARRRPINKEDYYNYLLSNAAGDNNPEEDDEVWMNSRTEPAIHFLAPPTHAAKHSAYETGFYGLSPVKRFMVAKRKKRSSGVSKSSSSGGHKMKNLRHGSISHFNPFHVDQ